MSIHIKQEEIEDGKRLYDEFQKGMSGGFFTSLFHSISKAKGENIFRCAKGFPGETYAYLEYTGMLNRVSWNIEGESTEDKFKREFPELSNVWDKELKNE